MGFRIGGVKAFAWLLFVSVQYEGEITTYTILGVPHYNYSLMGPKPHSLRMPLYDPLRSRRELARVSLVVAAVMTWLVRGPKILNCSGLRVLGFRVADSSFSLLRRPLLSPGFLLLSASLSAGQVIVSFLVPASKP